MKARLQPPSATLQGYSGGDLHIVSQVECDLSRGSYHHKARVLNQRDPLVSLLIGTDVCPKLGFLFLKREEGQVAMDLLQGESWEIAKKVDLEGKTESEKEGTISTCEKEGVGKEPITVRLLHATRLPP